MTTPRIYLVFFREITVIFQMQPGAITEYEMRREKMEHCVTIGVFEVKCSTGRLRVTMLERSTKWLNVGRVTNALKATEKA